MIPKDIGTLYLAGPMRGYALFNFPLFEKVTTTLRNRGFEVFSPAERDVSDGLDPYNKEHREAAEKKGLKYFMQFDLPAVMQQDALVVLPGWIQSAGARLEVFAAWAVDMPVYRSWDEALVPQWSIDLQTPYMLEVKR